MTPKVHSTILNSKHMTCILIILILATLFLIYMTWDSKPKECFKGGRKREGITYQSPSLQQYNFPSKKKDDFNIMRSKPVPKDVPTKANEKFSNEYSPPLVTMATKGYEPQSPFIGPINL